MTVRFGAFFMFGSIQRALIVFVAAMPDMLRWRREICVVCIFVVVVVVVLLLIYWLSLCFCSSSWCRWHAMFSDALPGQNLHLFTDDEQQQQ